MEEWREENLPECAIAAGGIHGAEITLEPTDHYSGCGMRLAKSHKFSIAVGCHLPRALTGEQHAGRISQVLLVA
jgi:hypothetical protein